MRLLGNGLSQAHHDASALAVREVELATSQRLGASEGDLLVVQSNLAGIYNALGRFNDALRMQRDVYSGQLRLHGEENPLTLKDANNLASALIDLAHFEEVKSVLRKTLPVARRVLGDGHRVTLKMKKVYASALYMDDGATLDDLREAETMLEEIERVARRVLGGAHPLTVGIEDQLRDARAALRARETPPSP